MKRDFAHELRMSEIPREALHSRCIKKFYKAFGEGLNDQKPRQYLLVS
jgi:hypothetical protein